MSLALLLGRAAGQRGPLMLVRETAAHELEERCADWGYSKHVVALDIVWNMTFVVASIVMLIWSVNEKPNVPLRVWIVGMRCSVLCILCWCGWSTELRRSVRRRESGSGERLESGELEGGEFRGGRFDLDGNDSDGDDDDGVGMFGSSHVEAKYEALKQSASQSGAQIEDDVLFLEAAEGFNKKGTVYGRGSESEAYYEQPTSARQFARATYIPSVLSQMEARLKKS